MSDSGSSTCGSECDSACGSAVESMNIPFSVQVTPDESFDFTEDAFGMRVDSLTLLKGTDCVIYREDPNYGKICLGRLNCPHCLNLTVNMEDFASKFKITCEGDQTCTVAVTGVLQETYDDDEEMMSDDETSAEGEPKESSVKIEEVPNLVEEPTKSATASKVIAEDEEDDDEEEEDGKPEDEADKSDEEMADSSESEDEPMTEEPVVVKEDVAPKKSIAEKKRDIAVQKRPAKKEPSSPKKAAVKSSPPSIEKETPAETKTDADTKGASPSAKTSESSEVKTTEVKTGVRRQLGKGLAYEILEVGKGMMAVAGKQANVKYLLTLAKTGQKMDSGVIKFRIGGGEVVPGFEKGVKGMCVFERRRIFVPSELGYGKKKTGKIPPNSDLIFEVTLMGIKN